jgi:2',3'-cyclic-nucleotide 2'-phosphodiesterase (5'-nucleotidase family)
MRDLVILQMNDLHGYLESHCEWFWASSGFVYRQAGGVARIKTLVDQLRAKFGDVLFCDGGDTFHGTRPIVVTKGACLPPILNLFGLSAMTGHWDFAYGPEELQRRVAELNYPFLAANVYQEGDGTLLFPPYRVVTVRTVRVGIIGLACNIVDKTMPANFSKGIRFTEGRDELAGCIRQLREQEKVDVVVLLSHLGFPQDVELLQSTPGVDVCLSSHTHNRLAAPVKVGDTLLIQSGCHGSFLGTLHLQIDHGGSLTLLEHELMEVSEEFAEDEQVRGLVNSAMAPFRAELDEVAGDTRVALNRATMLASTADDMILDAMLRATGAEVAFSNGWRYGAPVAPGPITVNDLYNLAPMDPEIMLLDLTGSEVWQMLEENLERTFSRDAFGQMGGYVKRCAGLTTFFKAENPKGSRIQEIFIGTDSIQRCRSYRAAYITVQGVPDKYGRNRKQSGITLIPALRQLLHHGYTSVSVRSFIEV